MEYDFVKHCQRAMEFSEKTFGPANRKHGITNHIRKECNEIDNDPHDIFEWIDVMILAIDGAWRAGYTPEDIASALEAKQTINENRKWPDWRETKDGEPLEHVRD